MFFSHAYKLFPAYAFQYLNPDYFHWSYGSAAKHGFPAASSSHPRGKGRTCSYLLKMTLWSLTTEQNLMIRKVDTQAIANSSVLRILKEDISTTQLCGMFSEIPNVYLNPSLGPGCTCNCFIIAAYCCQSHFL